MPSESEMKKIELATLYELRLTISESDKDGYTKEELLQLLDQIAIVIMKLQKCPGSTAANCFQGIFPAVTDTPAVPRSNPEGLPRNRRTVYLPAQRPD